MGVEMLPVVLGGPMGDGGGRALCQTGRIGDEIVLRDL